jgi:hypothetical protein
MVDKEAVGPRKARPDDKLCAVPTQAFRDAVMSRYRRLEIQAARFSARSRSPAVAAKYPRHQQIIRQWVRRGAKYLRMG